MLKEHNAYAGTLWEITEHSPIAEIKRGIQIFNDAGADAVVSVGGGSPIDTAKAILHFLRKERGDPIPPHIAIPTTLSAAEYTVGWHSDGYVTVLTTLSNHRQLQALQTKRA